MPAKNNNGANTDMWGRLGLAAAGMIERIGLLAFLFVSALIFVASYATAPQKEEIIDRFILGKGLDDWYPIGLLTILAIFLLAAQNSIWRKKTAELEKEIFRLTTLTEAVQNRELAMRNRG